MELKIKDKTIGKNQPVFIIAELSGNHNQNFELAVEMIKAAKEAGADAVKIQTYTPETITMDCDSELFQVREKEVWGAETLYQIYQKNYTPWEWQPKLKKIAEDLGLIFFSAPFDYTAVDFLEEMNVPAYKIASYEISDIPLIEYIASKGKPVFMSTGLATIEEITEAVEVCKKQGNNQIILLKCVSAYPTPLEDVNLKVIPDLKDKYGCVTGLSDHTLGISVPVASVALGAEVIEKHFVLDKSIGKVDTVHCSLDAQEFKEMVKSVREAEKALGKITYDLTEKIKEERKAMRSLFFVSNVKEGETITEQHVRSVRPAAGLPTKNISQVLGKKARLDIEKGTPVSWDLIE